MRRSAAPKRLGQPGQGTRRRCRAGGCSGRSCPNRGRSRPVASGRIEGGDGRDPIEQSRAHDLGVTALLREGSGTWSRLHQGADRPPLHDHQYEEHSAASDVTTDSAILARSPSRDAREDPRRAASGRSAATSRRLPATSPCNARAASSLNSPIARLRTPACRTIRPDGGVRRWLSCDTVGYLMEPAGDAARRQTQSSGTMEHQCGN